MLKIGEKIPSIMLPGSDGIMHNLAAYKGTSLVIYFYPKNETPGCVAEACAFRDQYEDFAAIGAQVIGISTDSVESHRRFIEKRKLPYLLLSDQSRTAERAFGVPRGLFGLLAGRVTFVVDGEGEIVYTFNSATQPTLHVRKSLEALKAARK